MIARFLFLILAGTAVPGLSASVHGKNLADYQAVAARFQAALELPAFDFDPASIRQAVQDAIARAEEDLKALAEQDLSTVSFDSTVGALDTLSHRVALVANRTYLVKETHPDAAAREAASDMIKAIEEWAIGLDYREDVYAAVKAYALTQPALEGEDRQLLEHVLRDYRRAGLELPPEERDEVERLRKKLADLSTDFQTNITAATAPVEFTGGELAGVPESFLASPGVKTGADSYTVMANVTWHYLTVMENARNPETRLRIQYARETLSRSQNEPLLNEIVRLRSEIARRLGYASWADFGIEPKMARTGREAADFLRDLKAGLQPKFEAELAELQEIKAEEMGDPEATLHAWDWRYYTNLLKKQKYTVDTEQLRVFFPYEQTLAGMFSLFESVFDLKIESVEAPQKWVADLQLFAISDAGTEEPMGLLYLDMFPREGKYNHFAQFGLIDGKLRDDGLYQRPVVALICNFPPPGGNEPSLLTHDQVETLFHEFGHALHSILTRAKYGRFSGTSVPRDFVEAPSQMLENWVWEKAVLDRFAADYRDPQRKIPAELIQQMKEARLATIGAFYRRQFSFGLLDLELHGELEPGQAIDAVARGNEVLSDVFLPVLPGTSFVTYFGHLTGYDAGYYGYAWADSIAADMATAFEGAPGGFLDREVGRRLRDEIYAPGGSREVAKSIEKFLGRPRSLDPFLKTLGIDSP